MELSHIGYSCHSVVFVVNVARQDRSCHTAECT